MSRLKRTPITPAEYVALQRLQALAGAVERELRHRLEAQGLRLPDPPRRLPTWPYKLDDLAWAAGLGDLTHDTSAAELARDVVAFALELPA